MRGILLGGGFGSRMRRFTDIQNKHLAPVYSKSGGAVPMIYYPLRTLIKSGISDILIISSQEHSGDIIEYLGDGSKLDADFTYKIQDLHDPNKPPGIASALKLAEAFTAGDSFAVILGDNFYSDTFETEINNFEYVSDKQATVFLKEVQDVKRFGCATIDTTGKVTKIVEKPREPESNLAVTGLYLYRSDVFKVARTLKPSARGELEVSDLNQHYVETGQLESVILPGFWSDMGTPESMLHTQEYIQNSNYTI